MDEMISIIGNLARLVVVAGGGFSVLAIAFAGFNFMTANGDAHKMNQAKMGAFGAIGGMVLMGIAFMAPGIISRTIIEPAGGQALTTEAGMDCDEVLKSQLVFQRGASTDDRMNVIIRQIQAQRQECSQDAWNPIVDDTNGRDGAASACFGNTVANAAWAGIKVGASDIPTGLRASPEANIPTGKVRAASGRDSNNNIIVYFGAGNRPSDNAKCWMYTASLRVWDQNYG